MISKNSFASSSVTPISGMNTNSKLSLFGWREFTPRNHGQSGSKVATCQNKKVINELTAKALNKQCPLKTSLKDGKVNNEDIVCKSDSISVLSTDSEFSPSNKNTLISNTCAPNELSHTMFRNRFPGQNDLFKRGFNNINSSSFCNREGKSSNSHNQVNKYEEVATTHTNSGALEVPHKKKTRRAGRRHHKK